VAKSKGKGHPPAGRSKPGGFEKLNRTKPKFETIAKFEFKIF
jgi:hypothetical protein